MDLPPAAHAALRALATARRAWSTPADLAALGHTPEDLAELEARGLAVRWWRPHAGAVPDDAPAEAGRWRAGDWFLTPYGAAVAGVEVRETWVVKQVGPGRDAVREAIRRGKVPPRPRAEPDLAHCYRPPGAAPTPDNPPWAWARKEAFMHCPSFVVDPHPGPEEEAIAKEEFVMATTFGPDGDEVTAPLEIMGVKVRPLRRPRKGA
jgi:hypothetical protein